MTSSPRWHLLLLLLAAALLFFLGIGKLPLLDPDEGRNAEVAREMLSTGDWITPHFDSLVYLDKPVFFFWLVAGSFRLWGISEWAARFPSALMALATMLLTWVLGRRMLGAEAGFRAGVVFATTPLVIVWSRLVIFDMTMTALVTLAMAAFWLAEASESRPAWFDVVAFAAMGLATIAKGPVGFLLPLLSLLAYHALRGRIRDLGRIHWGAGVAAFLGATLPWFLTVSLRNPDFPRYAFWQESLLRFATHQSRREGNIFYYLPVGLAGMFPWSLLLSLAGLSKLVEWGDLTKRASKPVVFLLSWAGVVFVFFSISRSKLPAYFLPATIPLSILMARVWCELETGAGALRSPGWLRAGFVSLIAAGTLIAMSSQLPLLDAVRPRIEKKLPLSLLATIKPSLLYAGVIVVALGWLGRDFAVRLRGRLRSTLTFTLLVLTMPALLVRLAAPLKAYAELDSSRQLAGTILASPERDLPVYGYYYFRTGLPFYLRRPVGLVSVEGDQLTSNYVVAQYRQVRLGKEPMQPLRHQGQQGELQQVDKDRRDFERVLMDPAELPARSRDTPMLLLVRNDRVGELAETVTGVEPLWSSWEYSVCKTGRR